MIEALDGKPCPRPIGYAILCGLGTSHRSIELKRIALSETDKGYGRRAIRLLKQLAFGSSGAHRLWLDVFAHNKRAQHVYASAGFVIEGTLRECVRLKDGYGSLILMSILEHEYRGTRD